MILATFLQQVAKRLIACLCKTDAVSHVDKKENDTVARLGGDEFVVILEDLNENNIDAAKRTKIVGEKILATLNQPYQLSTHEYHCTASTGATLFDNNEQTTDELMKQADIAMYQSKKAGHNTLRFFDPKMQDAINTHAILEGELRKAIKQDQLQLYYQIQVNHLHHPFSAEALIRWEHQERCILSPVDFIPMAEKSELILPIGYWVLETACIQLQTWSQDEHTRDLFLAINVSAKQFHQDDFITQAQTLLQQYAIDPKRLKLELTEGMLLENIEDIIATMNTLKKIGIQFSLDDFGTDYSSLQYLKRLPLDQFKIDQSFIRDIETNNSDKAIVCTIIAIAHSLNLDVIAEGVETEEQRQFLIKNDCHHFQDYLFGKPATIEQFDALLKQD